MEQLGKTDGLIHPFCNLPPGMCVAAVPTRHTELLCPATLPPLLRALVDEGRQYGAFFILKEPTARALLSQAPSWSHAAVSGETRVTYEQHIRTRLCDGAPPELEPKPQEEQP